MPIESNGLDEIDLAIVTALQSDGRRGVADIARPLGVHRNTVSRKLKRLLDQRIITPAIYAYPPALGYHTTATIGISVAPGEIDAVADRMVSLANVHYVFVCLGRYDIIIWGLFRDQDELYAFITRELGNTPGITGTEAMVSLGMRKLSFALLDPHLPNSYGDQAEEATPGVQAAQHERAGLDEQDLAIIGQLQRDARQSVAALAKALGIHRNIVTARLKRLSDQGTVRAVIAPDAMALGYRVMVAMGISVLPGAIDAALDRLKPAANIHSVTICTGRYDIMLWGFFRDQEELYDFIRGELGNTPGIRNAEAMVILRVKKMSFAYLTSHA
jgi:Lrp/AsnC family transcriptional regulator for asnA, asnC and gidA